MDNQSTQSNSDRLPMSSFLHTIPEGSSDIASSPFNPSAVPNGGEGSAWTVMMKPFKSEKSKRPAAPDSVASNTSTRAVEAGAAMDGSITSTAVAGLGEQDSVVAGAGGQGKNSSQSHGQRLPDHASLHQRVGKSTGSEVSKRRRPSVGQLNKRKVGFVCLLAVLLVMVVIVVLVIIVKQLGDSDGAVDVGGNSSQIESLNGDKHGNDSEVLLNTSGTSSGLDPTLPPTVAESTYLSSDADINNANTINTNSEPSNSDTSVFPATGDDLVGDDDAVDDATLTEDESLLVQLDEAIYMLYTSEDPRFNMLPHVSSEVFSNELSPRYQAREWLLNNDTLLQSTVIDATSTPSSPSMDTLERIAQRYVMLVLYFSTTATNALLTQMESSKFNVQPHTHECLWLDNACGQDDATTSTDSDFVLYLNISHANLKGTVPFELGYLSRLRELALDGNDFTGVIPELLLSKAQFLYVLDLSQNSLQGTIPTALWALPTLRFAYLHRNRFTGSIPFSLNEAPSNNLEEIWLRDNKLSGSIPHWWTQLPNLDVLSVSNNTWSGKLPEDWSQVPNLEFVDVSYNQITGTIPPSLLYGIPALQHLYIDYNQLNGTLPTNADVFGSAGSAQTELKMEALWLQFNQLSGTIPQDFGRGWRLLKELELHGNNIGGKWNCAGDTFWPLLEELAIDCLLPEDSPPKSLAQDENSTAGVDISDCSACCIKCF